MGMSASQARLLTLTARLSDLELEAQQISNAKIRLSQKTEQAATEYNQALDKQTLKVLSGVNTTTGTNTYVDATAYNLTTYGSVSSTDKQRMLEDSAGRVVVSDQVASAYQKAGGDETKFLNLLGYTSDSSANGTSPTITSTTNGSVSTSTKKLTYDSAAVTYYQNIFNQINETGYNAPGNENMNSTEWLYAQLSAGNIALIEKTGEDANGDGKDDWGTVSWSSGDSTLISKSDDSQIAKAEAKYDAATASIQSKDKEYDLQLQQINTEHDAIQTEFETVQKVIQKNIERSFKIFQA